MMPGGPPYGGLDLQAPTRVSHHHQQQPHHSQLHEVFPLTTGQNLECDPTNSMADYNKGEKGKNSLSEEDEHSFNDEGIEIDDPNKGKKVSHWQRVKWTDSMVRLLITAVSYMGDDAPFEGCLVGRRKFFNLHKKGKWKSVSKVMAERGFYVSPQQCEDKFNDLNKRYKKLNDILGRGTSCEVVEKPELLDMMDHLSEKTKDEVRKILSSKHLFYEEMCSYHNNNRLHLPHDPALQRSLQLALRTGDDNDIDSRRPSHEDVDVDENDVETEDHEEYEENRSGGAYCITGHSSKRMKPGQGLEDFNFGNPQATQDVNKGVQPQNTLGDLHLGFPESEKASWLQNQWLKSRSLQLEEQKVQIEVETLELEKQRFKWQRFTRKKDRELEKLRMENDRMRLVNERMALELKRMKMTMDCNN